MSETSKETLETATEDLALDRWIMHAKVDEDYRKVYVAVRDHKRLVDLPRSQPAVLHYKSYWDALSTEKMLLKLILYHERILVPKETSKKTLDTLHLQHCGINKTLANARQLYFWSGLTEDISVKMSGMPKNEVSKKAGTIDPD